MARDDTNEFDEQAPAAKNGPSLFLILSIAVAALAGVFVVQNRDQAEIQFLFFSGEFRIWVAISFAILLGVLLDRLILTWWRRARRNEKD